VHGSLVLGRSDEDALLCARGQVVQPLDAVFTVQGVVPTLFELLEEWSSPWGHDAHGVAVYAMQVAASAAWLRRVVMRILAPLLLLRLIQCGVDWALDRTTMDPTAVVRTSGLVAGDRASSNPG
jgi:hypothetical protein